jgi:PAS domain S-box-containing protein
MTASTHSAPRRIPGLATGAIVSFTVIALAYVALNARGGARDIVADIGWTWTSGYAAICALATRRRLDDPVERRGLAWIAVGCLVWLVGQVADDWARLTPALAPLLRDVASIGYVGIYPFLMIAVTVLLRPQLRRETGAEVTLDTILLTFTSGVLAYEFFNRTPLHLTGSPRGVTLGIIGGIGAVVLLWLILAGALHRTRALPTGTHAFGGLSLFAAGSVAYALARLTGGPVSFWVVALGWDSLFLIVALAVVIAPRPVTSAVTPPAGPTLASHLLALMVGVLGVFWVAISGILRPGSDPPLAAMVGIGGVILAARLSLALRADRRHARHLEDEVEHQTRSLSNSFATAAAAERNLRLLMEAVPDAIVVLDRAGTIGDFNAQARRMMAAGDTHPGNPLVFYVADDATTAAARAHLDAAFAGEVRHFEASFTRTDGSRGVSALLYAPIGTAGTVEQVLVLARDVSEQRLNETQLQQAEKLAALGQLVSGVAHEINNPAAIVSGFAQTLLLDDLNGAQREMVEMIRDEAMRIGRITSNLLAFARTGGSERGLVDLNDVVRRTYALRSYHLSTLNVTVAVELDPADPVVWGNGAQLQQLLLNLLINAEQALAELPGTRAIALRTRASATLARLDVSDSGPGVPPDIQKRIFDPFFTTKPVGIGTGLGLSICYGIAQEHGGRIWVESGATGGATFAVEFPRDPRAIVQPAADPGRVSTTGERPPTLRVLVVDDEPALRDAARRFLERGGIATDVVGDGAAALAAIATTNYDVIISDVRMPGMNGREFVERLRQERPELLDRLILSTGDTFAADTAALLREVGVPALVKPFDFDTLERTVRSAAARGRRGTKSVK